MFVRVRIAIIGATFGLLMKEKRVTVIEAIVNGYEFKHRFDVVSDSEAKAILSAKHNHISDELRIAS